MEVIRNFALLTMLVIIGAISVPADAETLHVGSPAHVPQCDCLSCLAVPDVKAIEKTEWSVRDESICLAGCITAGCLTRASLDCHCADQAAGACDQHLQTADQNLQALPLLGRFWQYPRIRQRARLIRRTVVEFAPITTYEAVRACQGTAVCDDALYGPTAPVELWISDRQAADVNTVFTQDPQPTPPDADSQDTEFDETNDPSGVSNDSTDGQESVDYSQVLEEEQAPAPIAHGSYPLPMVHQEASRPAASEQSPGTAVDR